MTENKLKSWTQLSIKEIQKQDRQGNPTNTKHSKQKRKEYLQTCSVYVRGTLWAT